MKITVETVKDSFTKEESPALIVHNSPSTFVHSLTRDELAALAESINRFLADSGN